MKPLVVGFPSNRLRAIGRSKAILGSFDEAAKAVSMKFDEAPESMRQGIDPERLEIFTERRKDISDSEVRDEHR